MFPLTHTASKEVSRQTCESDVTNDSIGLTPDDVLRLFSTDPDLIAATRLLHDRFPVLDEEFSYTDGSGIRRTVRAQPMALLLGAGFSHREVAEWLGTHRLTATRMAGRLREAGLRLRSAQQPKDLQRAVTARTENRDDSSPDRFTWRDYNRLIWRDDYHDRRFKKQHICVGVGGFMENMMEWLVSRNSDGKVTQISVHARFMSRFNPDRILERYWAGGV